MLYHGTHERALAAILSTGLEPRGRHHVHLSGDPVTARTVGARRGRPVVLEVDAAGMAAAGAPFFATSNGVWLVEAVPADRLRVVDR